jgi:two-component system, chemotaxis family, protein-glutamate methylesterase/glutaminase
MMRRGWISQGRRIVEPQFAGLAVVACLPDDKRLAVVLADPGEARDAARALVAFLSDHEIRNLEGLSIKLVGPSVDYTQAAEELQTYGVKVSGKVVSAGEPIDLLLDADRGRVAVAATAKRRVLIVDDSPTIRKMLRAVIAGTPGWTLVAETGSPSEVEALIEKTQPDVMTLDINMPEMNGDVLLKQLLPKRFIPTIVLTSLNINESQSVLNALEYGAIDYIQKPAADELDSFRKILRERLEIALHTKGKRRTFQPSAQVRGAAHVDGMDTSRVLAMGASTGGTEAIKDVLLRLPQEIPPTVIVQHIPPMFSEAFARRLNEMCPFEVREARDGDELCANVVLIAPGGKQMKVKKRGSKLHVVVDDSPPMTGHKPSVDFLFFSLAELELKNITAVLMTGMGKDGAKGMKAIKDLGNHTIAQDQETSIVFGMPKAAIEINAHCEISPLHEIAERLAKTHRRAA